MGSDTESASETGLVESWPVDGARDVSVGAWPVLRFQADVSDSAESAISEERDVRVALLDGIRLACDGAPREARIARASGNRLVLRPENRLPAHARCTVSWQRGARSESVGFETWARRPGIGGSRGLQVLYARRDPEEVAPVPDDFWTVADPTTRTGRRLELPMAARGDLAEMIEGLRPELADLDGWSPIAPIVLPLSGEVDPESVPRTVDDSLDPTATIALVDVDPESPERGRRWPFELVLRSDATSVGVESHAMWLLPAIPLRPGGRYAVLIRRGVSSPDGRAMTRPAALRDAFRTEERPGATPTDALETLIAPALSTAREALAIPWSEDDAVFALVFSVRTLDELPRDPLAMRDDVASLEGARLSLDSIEIEPDPTRPLAAIVRGRFRAPLWRRPGELALERDAQGRPRVVGTQALDFSLALPRSAIREPAPLLIYQHGNPGRAEEEVGAVAQDAFLEAGFAIAGFTDVWNRDPSLLGMDPGVAIIAQVLALTVSIRRDERVPDDWIHILGEQFAFIAALRELDRFDVLPVGAPDGRPEIDVEAPLVYEGISQGAIHGQALIAYAPEIQAASLVAGGARLSELLLHQAADQMVKTLPIVFGDLRPIDLWTLISLFQVAFDRQDAHLHALRVRSPGLRLRAVGESPRPSVLLVAGRGDRFVPNRASRSLAWVLGPLPWLHAPPERGIGLPRARAPLRGNLPDGTTGAYIEFVPIGSDLPPTPGCIPPVLSLPEGLRSEGHFCAQLAPESIRQRVTFLRSAVRDVLPVVIDPLDPDVSAETRAEPEPARIEAREKAVAE